MKSRFFTNQKLPTMTDSINYSEVLDTFFSDDCFSPEAVGIENTGIMIPSTMDAFDFIQNLNDQLYDYIESKWWWPTSTTTEFVLNSKKQVLCVVQQNY